MPPNHFELLLQEKHPFSFLHQVLIFPKIANDMNVLLRCHGQQFEFQMEVDPYLSIDQPHFYHVVLINLQLHHLINLHKFSDISYDVVSSFLNQ